MHCRSLVAAVVCIGILAPAASGSTTSCPGTDTTVSPTTLQSAKAAVLCMVNVEREARGLPAVAENDELALAAQRHTADMVARDYFEHIAPLPAPFGQNPGDRIGAAGYDWQAYGENIATGQTTPREVMTSWMASPGHCRNILSPDVTELGVGVLAVAATLGDQLGGTWTQDFANPQGTVAPPASSAPQAGCDGAGYPLAGPPAADPSADPDAATPSPEQNVDVTTTPNDAATTPARLDVTLRHVAGLLAVNGSLRPAPAGRRRVVIVVSRGAHVLRRRHTRLNRTGRFRVRLKAVGGTGPLTVRVSVGGLHVTRTVGR